LSPAEAAEAVEDAPEDVTAGPVVDVAADEEADAAAVMHRP
jgi:hypothetical protein